MVNYIEFIVRVFAFAVTLYLVLEFVAACEMKTWKATLIFSLTALSVIFIFFITKQHIMTQCPRCKTKKRGTSKMFTQTL